MVCPACAGVPHNGQPENCPGNTRCDCQHRAIAGNQQMTESDSATKMIEKEETKNV